MKRIVLCFDGTWNAVMNPKTVTNVVRLANLVTVSGADKVEQVTYYNSGVGSGGFLDRIIGGAFGAGLKGNVKRGIAFLALNYDKDDEVYLFGFSRGAYTARAVGGVIGAAGIPEDISQTEQHWLLYQELAKLKYQAGRYDKGSKGRKRYDEAADKKLVEIKNISRYHGADIPIRCVGVWDTVGAYGIPSGLANGIIPRIFTYWTHGFRDTRIGKKVDLGLHAVAIDEMRKPFSPTFWTLRKDRALDGTQEVEQVWFPGVHSNVGGGYDSTGLSDTALAWMLGRVQEKTPLRFNEDEVMRTVWPCSADTLYRSATRPAFMRKRDVLPGDFQLVRSRLRRLRRWLKGQETNVAIHRVNEKLHWSVADRSQCAVALVDGVGSQKYEPFNLARHAKEIAPVTALEAKLLERDRSTNCPLKAGGHACQCAQRAARAAGARPQASVAA
jgi:hypothetical protein